MKQIVITRVSNGYLVSVIPFMFPGHPPNQIGVIPEYRKTLDQAFALVEQLFEKLADQDRRWSLEG